MEYSGALPTGVKRNIFPLIYLAPVLFNCLAKYKYTFVLVCHDLPIVSNGYKSQVCKTGHLSKLEDLYSVPGQVDYLQTGHVPKRGFFHVHDVVVVEAKGLENTQETERR